MARLAALLQVRPREWRLVLLVAALFLCVQAGLGLGDNAASAIFFLRYGVENLPYMYMLLGVLTFLITLLYTVGLGRFSKRRFFSSLLAGVIVLLLLEWLAVLFELPVFYPLLWLTVSMLAVILSTFIWNVAGAVCDPRQAKRLFPLFASANILGIVVGNLITGPAAQVLGTENLLVLFALLLGLGLWLTRQIPLSASYPSAGKKSDLLADVRTGFDFVRGSPLLRLAALAAILFSILYFSMTFPFSEVAADSFADEAEVAGFLGLFTSIATAVTFLVSLLIANRVYARLGIVNSILLLPLTYAFGFVVFAVSYSLPGAAVARFSQLVILYGIASSAWNALFNIAPPEKRSQVLAFNNGVPSQVGVMLSGVLLILGGSVLTTAQIFWMGVVVALICLLVVWRMRAAYGQALIAALQAGRLDVFAPVEGVFEQFGSDPAALQVVVQALDSPRPQTRRLAAEMLARMGPAVAKAPGTAAGLIQCLADNEPDVCQAAAEAVGQIGISSAQTPLMDLLSNPEPAVRAAALQAVGRMDAELTAELRQILQEQMEDPSGLVQVQAAAALARLGAPDVGLAALTEQFSRQPPIYQRTAILAVLQELVRETHVLTGSGYPLALVEAALEDASPHIRAAACRLLAGTQSYEHLVACLFDEEPQVASAAADVLQAFWPEVRTQVLPVLQSSSTTAQAAALEAVPLDDPDSLEAVLKFVQREADGIRKLRGQITALPPDGRALKMLRAVLADRQDRREHLLIKAASLYSPPETLDAVNRSLHSPDPQTRSAALEALETLGDRRFVQKILPLLDDELIETGRATDDRPISPAEVLQEYLADPDDWVSALAAGAAAELGARELIPQLRALQSAPSSQLVRQSAQQALVTFGEVPEMETLATVSLLERLLLLREVPLFADLPPGDLEQVAEVAQEQLYAAGAEICKEGDPGQAMYVIVSGEVEVLTAQGAGEKRLALRGPGEFVGEMAIIEATPRSATLRAAGEVRVLIIEGQAVEAILRERPAVSIAMLRGLSRRLREISAVE
ncbi:MAG: HEAT repeat domain-containing protein [Anaerolineales bacterium]